VPAYGFRICNDLFMKLNVLGFVGAVNDNLLNLIELMNAIQAGRVLVCGTCLTPEACAQRT
jgi:hypothetical protein